MAPKQTPPTGLTALWLRRRRAVIVLLLVAAVPAGVFVAPGLAVPFAMASLGLATFAGGGPAHNGPQSPPSVPGE